MSKKTKELKSKSKYVCNSDTESCTFPCDCNPPCPIPKCKPKCVPMTLEIKPVITLVVDKPELDICNRAICKPSNHKKSKCKKSKCKKTKPKSPKKKCRCDCYEEYWCYYY